MTRFELVLDSVHNFSVALARMTKPRWHFNRERLLTVFGIGTALLTGVSVAFPQVKGLTWVVNLLQALHRTSEEVNRQLPVTVASSAETASAVPGLHVVPAEGSKPVA
jgi:hypothetical protein